MRMILTRSDLSIPPPPCLSVWSLDIKTLYHDSIFSVREAISDLQRTVQLGVLHQAERQAIPHSLCGEIPSSQHREGKKRGQYCRGQPHTCLQSENGVLYTINAQGVLQAQFCVILTHFWLNHQNCIVIYFIDHFPVLELSLNTQVSIQLFCSNFLNYLLVLQTHSPLS